MPAGERPKDLADDLLLVGKGDLPAFRRIYRATASKLFLVCFYVTRDRAAAEDVLQDVYVKVWRSAGSYDPVRAGALSWLGTIARNSAIDWYRSRANRPVSSDEKVISAADEAEPVDQRMIREHSEEAALHLVSQLSGNEEEQLRTIYFQGLTYAQLAERDGVPLGTVKSQVRRTLAKLRQKLNDE